MRHWSADSRTCTMEEGRDTACRCLHAARTAPRSTTTPRSKVLEEGRERTSCETSLSLSTHLGASALSSSPRGADYSHSHSRSDSLPPPRSSSRGLLRVHASILRSLRTAVRSTCLFHLTGRKGRKEGREHEAGRRRRADEHSEDELQAKVAAVSADWEREPQALAPSAAAALPLVETKEDSVGLDSGIERINAQRRAYAH